MISYVTTEADNKITVIASGNWDNATNAGTRYRNANNARSNANGNHDSHSCSRQGLKFQSYNRYTPNGYV